MNQNLYEWVQVSCLSTAIGLSLFLVDRIAWKDYSVPEYKTFSAPILVHRPFKESLSLDDKIEYCTNEPECSKLAEAVVFESRGEGMQGMVAVAYVIKNRTEHQQWPDTVYEVIHQPHQFEYLSNIHRQKKPKESDWEKAKVVAFDVLHGKIEDVSNGATHYYSPSKVNPNWSNRLEYVVTIGEHRFMK